MHVVICRFFFDSQFPKLVMRDGSSTLQLLLFFLSFSLYFGSLFDYVFVLSTLNSFILCHSILNFILMYGAITREVFAA